MICTLLTKVVIFYMRISIIKFRVSRLKKPDSIGLIFKACWMVSSLLDTGFHKLSEQYIGEANSGTRANLRPEAGIEPGARCQMPGLLWRIRGIASGKQ